MAELLDQGLDMYTNTRLEGLNGLFQAARARARGYRNTETFMTMIYLIASPAGKILESTWNARGFCSRRRGIVHHP